MRFKFSVFVLPILIFGSIGSSNAQAPSQQNQLTNAVLQLNSTAISLEKTSQSFESSALSIADSAALFTKNSLSQAPLIADLKTEVATANKKLANFPDMPSYAIGGGSIVIAILLFILTLFLTLIAKHSKISTSLAEMSSAITNSNDKMSTAITNSNDKMSTAITNSSDKLSTEISNSYDKLSSVIQNSNAALSLAIQKNSYELTSSVSDLTNRLQRAVLRSTGDDNKSAFFDGYPTNEDIRQIADKLINSN